MANLKGQVSMANPIARALGWLKARFVPDGSVHDSGLTCETAEEARASVAPFLAPGPAESSFPHPADVPQRAACGVYLWATAHGIDLRPQAPLFTCTCSGKHSTAVSAREELRAKVADVNHRSRREHGMA